MHQSSDCPPAGSIEEKIWQRQLAKEGLSRVVVDDNRDESRTFSKCAWGMHGHLPVPALSTFSAEQQHKGCTQELLPWGCWIIKPAGLLLQG